LVGGVDRVGRAEAAVTIAVERQPWTGRLKAVRGSRCPHAEREGFAAVARVGEPKGKRAAHFAVRRGDGRVHDRRGEHAEQFLDANARRVAVGASGTALDGEGDRGHVHDIPAGDSLRAQSGRSRRQSERTKA
jgi:hypothetical protein